MVIIPLFMRHQGSQDRGSVASSMNQPGPMNEEPKEEEEPLGLMHTSLYISPSFI